MALILGNNLTLLVIYVYIRNCVLCARSGFVIYHFATFHMEVKRKIVMIGMKFIFEMNVIDKVKSRKTCQEH